MPTMRVQHTYLHAHNPAQMDAHASLLFNHTHTDVIVGVQQADCHVLHGPIIRCVFQHSF